MAERRNGARATDCFDGTFGPSAEPSTASVQMGSLV